MEYSKENVLNSRYHEINIIKNTAQKTSFMRNKIKNSKSLKLVITISIICTLLIVIDIMLIYGFAHALQNMI